MQQAYLASIEDEGYHSKTIRESKYKQANIPEVCMKQTHMSQSNRNDLQKVLSQFPDLFNGKLGKYQGKKVHLDVEPQDKKRLRYQRHYLVPHAHRQVFYDELQRLVQQGVLSPCGASSHAAPTFLRPKKDGRVRWISDFRELNKIIKRKVYPLPVINDVLKKRKGYRYLTKLDISMQYYTFELDDEAKELCVISTPFGNFFFFLTQDL